MAKFCAKCGCELKDGAKFCPKCGNPVIFTPPKRETSDNSLNYSIELISAGYGTLQVTKALIDLLGVEINEAKYIINTVPHTLATGLSLSRANEIKLMFQNIGAEIAIKQTDKPVQSKQSIRNNPSTQLKEQAKHTQIGISNREHNMVDDSSSYSYANNNQEKEGLELWVKIGLTVALLLLFYSILDIRSDSIKWHNIVISLILIGSIVSAFMGKIERGSAKILMYVCLLWYPVLKLIDNYEHSKQENMEYFYDFKDALPHDGSRLFIADNAKPYGSKNVTLKWLILYEKDDNRDYIIEGETSSGRIYREEGKWTPRKSETYQAREYQYTSLSAGNIFTECTNYFVNYDGRVYFCYGILTNSKDVADAFGRGAIAKLRIATKEEAEKWRLEKSHDSENKSDNTITANTPEEKEFAEAGYKAGSDFGSIGDKLGGFFGMLDLADAVGATKEEMDGAIRRAAIREYEEKYNSPTNSKEERLKEIFIESYVIGFKSTTKSTN